MSTIAERVKQRREALGMNQKQLSAAVKAKGGSISQAQISAMETGIVNRPRSLPELAAALQVSIDWLVDDDLPPDRATSASPMPRKIVTVPVQQGAIDLPVFGCIESLGGLMLDPTPIQMIERPPGLRYSPSAFGIYCPNAQQAPAFEPKDTVLIDPSRPAMIGDDALLVRNFDGSTAAPFDGVLRRLIGQTDTHWRVRQFNPAKDYNLSKAEWPRALFVAGKYSR